jgi:hypothetical protein
MAVFLASYWFLQSRTVEAQVSQGSKLLDLQQQRLATLSDLVTITRDHYKNGEVSYDELLSASRARDEAELALCASSKERIATLVRMVTTAKELEAQAAKLAADKLLARRVLLKATADRLQEEILLEQAQAK